MAGHQMSWEAVRYDSCISWRYRPPARRPLPGAPHHLCQPSCRHALAVTRLACLMSSHPSLDIDCQPALLESAERYCFQCRLLQHFVQGYEAMQAFLNSPCCLHSSMMARHVSVEHCGLAALPGAGV